MPKPRNHEGDWSGRKPGSYKWFEIQDEVAYFKKFEGEKISFPEIAKESRFAFDTTGIYPLKTSFSIMVGDLYLLGVLNSKPAWEFLKQICSVLGDAEKGGRLTLQKIFVEQLPIPTPAPADRAAIEELVSACLLKRGAGCAEEEAELDARVATLYGLES